MVVSSVNKTITVHKFGGSSLANKACVARVIDIIEKNCQLDDVIVVSANGNTTDNLMAVITARQTRKAHELELYLDKVMQGQKKLINDLLNSNFLSSKNHQDLHDTLIADIKQLRDWLKGDYKAFKNDILAFGELWSARLLSVILNDKICPSIIIDARDFLVIANEQKGKINYDLSKQKLESIRPQKKLAVVTGYIGKDVAGDTCTLGRNGSDYSATILASLIHASNVILWTDVDGIYSADPRIVPNARKLHRLPNGVAKELGRLGNPILHAKTLTPLVNEKNNHHIHLHVASSFDAQVIGTEIGKFGQIAKQELSITYLNDLFSCQFQNIDQQTFVQITDNFPSVCFDENRSILVVTQYQYEIVTTWLLNKNILVIFKPVAIIATVGHKIAQQGDIKARFKRSLKRVNPVSIINGDNFHSIIAILNEPCTSELINNVHHHMTKDVRNIGVIVAGLGNIGERFLELLPAQLSRVSALENLHLVGLLSSKNILINDDGIDFLSVEEVVKQFTETSKPFDTTAFIHWLSQHPYDDLIIVDITPSEKFSTLYEEFFQRGIHVVGANKWAASTDTKQYNYLKELAEKNNCLWLGNTTVGAGLPINFALNGLRQSGDNIQEISGIFSGTLSWLFEIFDGTSTFSSLLLKALEQGLTEPDPREDLSGRDVQRKLLILARMAGFELSLDDIDCQNLVPEHLQTLTTGEFLARVNELDHYFAEQLTQAQAQQRCIRYVARFSNNAKGITAKVSLESLATNDAFANLTPCDNIFQIKSRYYNDNPLIIRGPGAGRDVTASGLHSDLVTLCQQLEHKQHQVKIKGINQ